MTIFKFYVSQLKYTVLFYKLTVKVDIGIYMTFVVQATTVLAEKTSLEDKLSKKPDYFIRDKIANFIYWF